MHVCKCVCIYNIQMYIHICLYMCINVCIYAYICVYGKWKFSRSSSSKKGWEKAACLLPLRMKLGVSSVPNFVTASPPLPRNTESPRRRRWDAKLYGWAQSEYKAWRKENVCSCTTGAFAQDSHVFSVQERILRAFFQSLVQEEVPLTRRLMRGISRYAVLWNTAHLFGHLWTVGGGGRGVCIGAATTPCVIWLSKRTEKMLAT